ncbi:MAG: SpoIIE family protein phosphatase, partial [Gemmatimonadaceae bacterium]
RPAPAIPVTEASQVGESRRQIVGLAAELGFGETERGRVAIVASELATNLVRHGDGGELIIRPLLTSGIPGIEILSLDRGPGIRNVEQALSDGFSTAGTSGHGLGGVGRLTSLFDVFSIASDVPSVTSVASGSRARKAPSRGTALAAQLWAAELPSTVGPRFMEGVVSLPYPGESVCGDAWAIERDGERAVIMVADGLGHGPAAAEASAEMVRVFRDGPLRGPAAIIDIGHIALRSTRGAAVAVADIDMQHGTVRFSGVGNISAAILDGGESHSMMSHNGTVGYEMRKAREVTYAWQEKSLLVMHSDGLHTNWRLDSYPGLALTHPSIVAGVLYRDFTRGRDDVTVLVARDGT